jgi:hypothetical protein
MDRPSKNPSPPNGLRGGTLYIKCDMPHLPPSISSHSENERHQPAPIPAPILHPGSGTQQTNHNMPRNCILNHMLCDAILNIIEWFNSHFEAHASKCNFESHAS